MTTRTLALSVAALVVPALWGWLLPPLLARVWPRHPPTTPLRSPLPDYEI